MKDRYIYTVTCVVIEGGKETGKKLIVSDSSSIKRDRLKEIAERKCKEAGFQLLSCTISPASRVPLINFYP